mmetsp:Transcript_45602/g.141369  ORF Transcript_45602/g.141369 Transcript_45602/m.141369 type:complete len:605 (-) Transcript_45602:64-1878(-)
MAQQPAAGQTWEVVGGGSKGGILVREGEATSSQELAERLSHGAWVREERLEGQRLCYRLLSGQGPERGWVSVRLKEQELLARRSGPPPGWQPAPQRVEAAPSADAGTRPAQQAAAALQQEEILSAVFRNLRLPWAGAGVAAVCHCWHAFLLGPEAWWSTLRLGHPRELPALQGLLTRAGPRLRTLDLSKAGKGVGSLQGALRACSNLEDLNLAGCDGLSLGRAPDVLAALSRSLRRLNIQGCGALHASLPAMVGAKLQHLEAGWLSENDGDRVWAEWTRIFPRQLFRQISAKCPALVVLRFPGFALYNGQPEAEVPPLLQEYGDIGRLASLRQLQRLELSCAQLLEDPAITKIATGCRRLRSLGLRCCENVTDRGLLSVADNLGGSLAHINISCCQFSERAVRRLITRCRGLKTLDLCYCRGLGAGLLSFLCADDALCPQLRMIGAGGLDVGDAEMAAMCRKYRGTLEHLGIGAAARLTDAGLALLAELPHLRRLSAHQLQGVSAAGLTSMCLRAPCLTDVDADGCDFKPPPGPEELEALQRCLAERAYDYDARDEESDEEDVEKEKERRERERREKERAEKQKRDEQRTVLVAMEKEMQGLLG